MFFFVFANAQAETKKFNMVFVPASEKGDESDYKSLISIVEKLTGFEINTIKVTEKFEIEKYSHVMHIVSNVEGKFDKKHSLLDTMLAGFPAGTVTGAPKIRAMELIAGFENLKRSFYSGSIAYFGFDGNMDSAITIRTTLIKDDLVVFQSGAGVVADSVPELEFLEVNNKLAANISTLEDLSKL